MNKRTARLLEKHFDTAFAAPDGIAKLRELILTLAMQGKLVEQDINDQPASALLKEIETEKQRLVKAGSIKKPKPLPPIKPDEMIDKLPKGWVWVRLGEIGIINPRNDGEDSSMAGFVPMPMIPEGYSEKHQFEERLWSEIKKGYTHFADGDVGMAKITPCFENAKSCVFSGLPNGIGAGTTELHIFRNAFNSVNPRFLLYYLKNPHYISKAVPKMTGSAGQKRVPTPYFAEQLFALPPLPEQHRIVARIDQLMTRCNELEKLRKQREELRLAVHAAAIKQLLDVPDGSAWDFIQQHFGELYTVKENVAELRKAILQLAVMGRLVEQDPNDPPASELLKEIEIEKVSREGAKTRRVKGKKLLPVQTEEVPYKLPQGWEWVRLGNLNPEYQNGISKRGSNDGHETIVLRLADIVGNEISLEDTRSIQLTKKEVDKYLLNDGDILITRVNGSVDLVGSFIRVGQIRRPVAYCDHFIRMKLPLKFVDVDYLHVISKGDLVRCQIEGKFVTTAGQKTVNQTHIATLFLPLPPLPEQHRIVARVDQLMALCNTLEQQIDAATGKQTELLGAVMGAI